MKISGFTFLRNAHARGYPFGPSIRSILPLVDEFVVALGPCEDETEALLRGIGDPKIRILHTTWNENISNDLRVKGFVYGQQKSIALFQCTGDWAFYLEADEVVHEDDLPILRAAMEQHMDNPRVEALTFDYLHFYGNGRTLACSPAWYRREPRILRNTIPAWGPEGLFFVVLDTHKRGRYPRAAHSGARIFHYGWARPEPKIQQTKESIEKYWSNQKPVVNRRAIDPLALKPYDGTHPRAIQEWLSAIDVPFAPDPAHRLTQRERKHRIMMKIERWTGWDLTKKHYRPVR